MDTNATLTQEIKSYYEDIFLDRANPKLVMAEGSQSEVLGSNNGATVTFTRYAVRPLATTPLSTGVNPTHTANTAVNVVATLAEYGDNEKIAKFLSTTSIDKNNAEKIEVMGDGMGNTLDAITRDSLFSGATVQYANSRASLVTVAQTDVLNFTEIAKARRTLITNNAQVYDDNMFMAKIQPFTEFDVITSTGWVNIKSYQDGQDLYRGEIGSLYMFRFLMSTQHKVEAAAGAAGANVYSNFFHGKNAFGTVNLEGDMPKLVIVTGADGSNVAGRFANISWAGSYTAKVLNATWILNVKTGASV